MRDDEYPHVTLSEAPPPRYPNLFRFEINNESMNVVYIPVFRLN